MMYLKFTLSVLLLAGIVACGGGGGSSNKSPGPTAGPTAEPSNEPSSEPSSEPSAEPESDGGYAGYNFDLKGGADGNSYTVNNGADLQARLDSASDTTSPVTIYVDGTITEVNTGGTSIDIKEMDNVSIIGVADRGEFDGVGFKIRKANNIIIQNLKIKAIYKGDAISIENNSASDTTSNIWIDHNELYGSLSVDKDYYDGLIDSKSGAENITISYNYIHDHWKVSLHGSSDDDAGERKITFHHNRFENLVSRVPLFRYGTGHLYNNYYKNIDSTAINSRMEATLLVENNIFEDTKNPIVSFYSRDIGYWNSIGNEFTNVSWSTPDVDEATAGPDGVTGNDSSISVPYEYTLDPVAGLKDYVIANTGIGKISQSADEIPEPDTPANLVPTAEPAVPGDVTLPYAENFAAANTDEFFSADYRDTSGGSGTATPMYHRVTGTATITSQQLTLTGSRVTIGNTTPAVITTAGDASTTGVLDLDAPYQIKFKVLSVGGTTTKKFLLYVDNNTSGQDNSIHGKESKFYSAALDSYVLGETVTVPGYIATNASFITLRTESDSSITIDDLVIELLN